MRERAKCEREGEVWEMGWMRRGQDMRRERKRNRVGDGFNPDRFTLVHAFWWKEVSGPRQHDCVAHGGESDSTRSVVLFRARMRLSWSSIRQGGTSGTDITPLFVPYGPNTPISHGLCLRRGSG